MSPDVTSSFLRDVTSARRKWEGRGRGSSGGYGVALLCWSRFGMGYLGWWVVRLAWFGAVVKGYGGMGGMGWLMNYV
jgi:hypothetical protein